MMADIMQEISRIALPARVDSSTSQAVGAELLDAMRPGARVIVDAGAVSYMSAAGVRVLATAIHRAQEQNTHIVLCRFTGAAADCLLVSGFSQLFDVAASLEEAERRLGGQTPAAAGERLHVRRATG